MEFMGVYEIKNAIREARVKNYGAIVDELKGQARLGMAMFKLKRMHAGFMMAKGRKEIKALYRKAKKRPTVSPGINP
jgi:heterodisulfide reductase subunit C